MWEMGGAINKSFPWQHPLPPLLVDHQANGQQVGGASPLFGKVLPQVVLQILAVLESHNLAKGEATMTENGYTEFKFARPQYSGHFETGRCSL